MKPSDGPTNRVIRAELVSTNSVAIPLIQIGDGRFGFQNRSFAYWLLNGPINAVPDTYSLRVHFPENHPVDIPVERK